MAISTRSGEVFSVQSDGIHLIDKSANNVDNIWKINHQQKIRHSVFNNFVYNHSRTGGGGLKDIKELDDKSMVFTLANCLNLRHSGHVNKLNYKYNSANGYIILDGERFTGCDWSDRDSLFYYTTNFGVFSRGWSDSISHNFLFKNKTFQSNDILVHNNNLICATNNHGLLFFKDSIVIWKIRIGEQ